MFRRLTISAALLLLLTISSFAQSTTTSRLVGPANAGFEEVAGALPAGWIVSGKTTGETTVIQIDPSVAHAGSRSLRIEALAPGSTTLSSPPVRLEVGHLYRLSGWIKTDRAHADPTARYPTPVAATLTMASFPFTQHAGAVAGTGDWNRVEVLFFATASEDRVELHLGYNGTATGTAWFDDVCVEEEQDISAYIPPESVRWFGPAFRYADNGWTFIHIEGEPYERGYQYGTLLAKEIGAFMDKLAIRANEPNPKQGWSDLRTLADALMLRKYDEEYLTEMKGIADGAAHGGGQVTGRIIDLLDVVTMNSAVDLGQLPGALSETPHALSGRSFRAEEEEMLARERLHKCSSFLANGKATPNGDIVFGQLFMWGGYTGMHWEVICDVMPARGHRLVYETFPGGIHSGADFYINDAGVMIGETTVMQTPFDADGTPQSSRIRKAAQYAENIDDVVRILTEKNNGLYTNDWLIGDVNKGETAILLLGTHTWKLWRSSKHDFPGETEGFYWSVNNAKDPGVRKEYVPDPSNAPFDVVYNNVNRDLAFTKFYRENKGKIDLQSGIRILASSPINRPHACDGKITNSVMARQMMFLAHYGKVTLREKFPEKNSRLMPDLPNSVAHLTLGYTTFSPVYVVEKLKEAKRVLPALPSRIQPALDAVRGVYTFDKAGLWLNTVYPASDADNWFVSGTAAYWNMLNGLPADLRAAMPVLRDHLAEMNCKLLYTTVHEGTLAPLNAHRRYDGFAPYIIPRIRGTYLLHQLRLRLGNDLFGKMMNVVHGQYREKPMTTAQFIAAAEKATGTTLRPLVMQWLSRDDLPSVRPAATVQRSGPSFTTTLRVRQTGTPYTFTTTVALEGEQETVWKSVAVDSADQKFTFTLPWQPRRVVFNAGNDIPVAREAYSTFSNYFDDFDSTLIVYGIRQHGEAQRTLALRFQTLLADQFTEVLTPVVMDAEVGDRDIAVHDLILLGGLADNAVVARLADSLGLSLGKNLFRWEGRTFAEPDDGLFVTLPNPYNPRRSIYCFIGNSALQIYQMTKRFQSLPSWTIFKGEQVIEKGYLPVKAMSVPVGSVPVSLGAGME